MNSSRILWPAEGWLRRGLQLTVIVGIVAAALMPLDGHAQDKILNLYSARHYQTDEALYSDFTKQSGIKINRIELGDEQLLQRLKTEGANSPADVVLLVDAARLWRAQVDGLFQPVQSKVLDERIPANLRSNDGTWFGFSLRARAIVYDKSKLKAEDVDTYEKLADPKLKGLVCTRSGSHPYMLSLIGALIEVNRRSQDRGVGSRHGGQHGAATTRRRHRSDQGRGGWRVRRGADQQLLLAAARCAPRSEGQGGRVEGGLPVAEPGDDRHARQHLRRRNVAKNAPNKANAVLFLEYLSGPQAQTYFADGNNEWPVVKGAKTANAALEALGTPKFENVPVSTIGKNQIAAQRILDRVGYR